MQVYDPLTLKHRPLTLSQLSMLRAHSSISKRKISNNVKQEQLSDKHSDTI